MERAVTTNSHPTLQKKKQEYNLQWHEYCILKMMETFKEFDCYCHHLQIWDIGPAKIHYQLFSLGKSQQYLKQNAEMLLKQLFIPDLHQWAETSSVKQHSSMFPVKVAA